MGFVQRVQLDDDDDNNNSWFLFYKKRYKQRDSISSSNNNNTRKKLYNYLIWFHFMQKTIIYFILFSKKLIIIFDFEGLQRIYIRIYIKHTHTHTHMCMTKYIYTNVILKWRYATSLAKGKKHTQQAHTYKNRLYQSTKSHWLLLMLVSIVESFEDLAICLFVSGSLAADSLLLIMVLLLLLVRLFVVFDMNLKKSSLV